MWHVISACQQCRYCTAIWCHFDGLTHYQHAALSLKGPARSKRDETNAFAYRFRVDRGNAQPRGNAPSVNVSYLWSSCLTNEPAHHKADLFFSLCQSDLARLFGRRRCSETSLSFLLLLWFSSSSIRVFYNRWIRDLINANPRRPPPP